MPVHAWSVFRIPLTSVTGWSTSQVTLAVLALGCRD
jgi:hypothetical protein